MNAVKKARWAIALALPLLAGTVQAAVPAYFSYAAPGVVAPSDPHFLDSNESITIKRLGSGANRYYQLIGTGATTSFLGPISQYNLGSDSVKYVANFDLNGRLITQIGNTKLNNTLTISGTLPKGSIGDTSWNALPNQVLLSATLLAGTTGTAGVAGGGTALGFATQFTGGWAANQPGLTGGSTGESLWLFSKYDDFKTLVRALDGVSSNGTLSSLIGSGKTITHISSVASVPVPAAAWLFATGLMGLLAKRRQVSDLKAA